MLLFRNIVLILTVSFTLCSGIASAQYSNFSTSLEGGRGLLSMESARTYGKGAIVMGLKGLMMKRESPVLIPGGRFARRQDNTGILGIPITFGLTDEVDISASFYGFNDARIIRNISDTTLGYTTEPEGGMGSSRISVKVRLPFSMDSRLQIAGRFGALLGTSSNQIDGINYRWSRTGTDIETSLYETLNISSFLSLHLEQGYILSGSDIYDDQIVGAAGIQLRMKDRFALNLEVMNHVFRGVSPQSIIKAGDNPDMYKSVSGIPMTGNPLYLKDTKSDYKEDYFTFTPSLVFRVTQNISVDIGAVINIADQVGPREKFQGILGITFGGEIKAMNDSDRDGVNNRTDLEPNTPRGYPVDIRGISLDSDADSIPDGIDKEPNTPIGARVNAFGIGIDSDEDGVFDGLDMDPSTPKGALVDKYGVAFDDDKDGVPNGMDLEPDTPLGAVVNKNGVALDDDKDGVPNGLDREPDTLVGAKVDMDGVGIDSDSDGVPDGIDLEPNTPNGILVDKSGRAFIRQEYRLLREGLIRLNFISFAPGSAVITPESYSVIDEIGRLLRKYPTLKIQIGGHSDNIGDKETNYRLSRDRALFVRDYLFNHFPEIQKDRLIAIGFGPDKPIASNATAEGRIKNRRVEFVVINQEELLNLKP